MALNPSNSPSPDTEPMDETAPVCVLVFNASDPSGAGGLSADIATIASVGGHPLPVVTGAYARDSAKIFEHFPFDDEAVAEQARAVLEDIPVSAIKVGFVGSPGYGRIWKPGRIGNGQSTKCSCLDSDHVSAGEQTN